MIKSGNGSLSESETLRQAMDCGILNLEEISERVQQMKRQEILAKHSYWCNTDGLWMTRFPDKQKGRITRKRKKKEDLEDLIIEYYEKLREKIYIKDVFEEWINSKRDYGEIQPQSYDRYCTDYKRFFSEKLPICKKEFSDITEDDLTDFIKSTIHNLGLTKKSYAGLRTLVRGIFKYGKDKKYTSLSMTQFFRDLELPNNIFEKRIINKETEVFNEDEIPVVISYLRNHADIWNLGLLLQFQTGMRIGEISALKREDIQQNGTLLVHRTEVKCKDESGKWTVYVKDTSKTDAGNRTIILPDNAKWTLDEILKLNPHGEYLFMNRGKRIRENTFNKRLSRVCEELRIEHRTSHKIRKTYGTTLLDCGVNESTVSEQLGHTDIATTRKYYYFSNKNTETKLKQINNAVNF
mgnify:FL=1